jgi:hypothetical protein
MAEFEKPWESTVQVGQGQGKISKEGKPLQSEGFGQCFGLILRNRSNLESALFHVDDIDLTHKQTPTVEELMRNYVTSLDIDSSEREDLIAAIEDITHYRCPQNYGRMNRGNFQLRMEELNSDGIIQARFVRGDDSRDVKSRIVGSLLGYLGVNVMDDLTVNTGRQHWAMVYKPNEAGIYVDARNQKKVLKFTF